MSNLEFFKKQSKNFLKDWKSQTKIVETDGNVYFRYSPKFFDIEDWFSYFDLSAKDEQDVKLSRAQHYIAKIAGFKKWTDLVAAPEKELIYAEIKLRNFKNSMNLIQWDYIEKHYELADLDIDSKIEYAKQFFKGVNVTGLEGEEKAITPKIITGRTNSLVFELPLKNGTNVFMRIDCGCNDNQKYILILDLQKVCKSPDFTKILDNKIFFENPDSSPDFLKNKIRNCLDGFSKGITNPVPLAEISYCVDEVRFINGITRISYLAAYCVSSIPIECDKESVESLFNLYGNKNYEPHSLEEYRLEYENKIKIFKRGTN